MNELVEKFNYNTGDYWGEARGLRFRTNVESFSHAVELQVEQDRMVKVEFDLKVNGYLLPDVVHTLSGNRPTNNKWFTPKKIIIGQEIVATDFNMESLDPNTEKWRNQNYPNLQKDVVILPPPEVVGNLLNSPNPPPIRIPPPPIENIVLLEDGDIFLCEDGNIRIFEN